MASDRIRIRPATEMESDLVADLVSGTDEQVSAELAVAVFGARDHEQLGPLFRQVWRHGQSWRVSAAIRNCPLTASSDCPLTARCSPNAVVNRSARHRCLPGKDRVVRTACAARIGQDAVGSRQVDARVSGAG